MQTFEEYKKKTKLSIGEQKLYHRFVNDEIYWEKDDKIGFELSNTDCCAICFESNPLVLEQHHIAGRNNAKATVTVCSNHHRILSRKQSSWPKLWTNKDNHDDLKFLFLFLGLTQLESLVEYKLPRITPILLLMGAYQIHKSENKDVDILLIISLTLAFTLLTFWRDEQ